MSTSYLSGLRRLSVLVGSTWKRPWFEVGSASLRRMSSGSCDASGVSVMYVTCPDMKVAQTLSRGLVGDKLAACVNIIPQVTSVYKWEDKIEEDSESMMVIKTQNDLVSSVTKYIESHHPYDVPEVICLPVTNGSLPYLNWIKKETSTK